MHIPHQSLPDMEWFIKHKAQLDRAVVRMGEIHTVLYEATTHWRRLAHDEHVVLVSSNGLYIRFIPFDMVSPDVALAAVTQNGRALFTPELFEAAVTQNPCMIDHIPWDFVTPHLKDIAAGRHRARDEKPVVDDAPPPPYSEV